MSRTYLNGTAHAAEACTPPFRAGQDRPDLDAGYCSMEQMPPLADRITLCDRKVRGERAPTRRSACQGWSAGCAFLAHVNVHSVAPQPVMSETTGLLVAVSKIA
jgi:hypothetical protein